MLKRSLRSGKSLVADLERKSYPIDTSAQAIILFDVGQFNGSTLMFTRNLRIKILKKGGQSWGNWVFNTPSTSEFKVTVYNLEFGKVVAEKASGKSIYNEQVVNEFHVSKVFAPNVKVGSVIDISYNHAFALRMAIPAGSARFTVKLNGGGNDSNIQKNILWFRTG